MKTFQAPTALSSIPATAVRISDALGAGGITVDPVTGHVRFTDTPGGAYGVAADPVSGRLRAVALPHAEALRAVIRLNTTTFTV